MLSRSNRTARLLIALAAAGTLVVGCTETDGSGAGAVTTTVAGAPTAVGSSTTTPESGSASTSAPTTGATGAGQGVDLTHLPVGDGRASTAPERGYVWSCQTRFNGGGASTKGPWFNGDGTWDATKKQTVDGEVDWPSSFKMSVSGDKRQFTGNDLPEHTTGVFPVSRDDDVYLYDRNPNSISAQVIGFQVPAEPQVASQPSCVGGEVGIMLSGAMLFDAFDAGGRDAVAWEAQDHCSGHPQERGAYHYHNISECVNGVHDVDGNGHSVLLGYAFDGFGIYGHHDVGGKVVTNADLDECHGHTGPVEWEGRIVEMYHYHATFEVPYTVGCVRGTPARVHT
ncbi:MAG: YHYH protein [Microthrixaceae bacterium]